jgi:predicted glycogen debranching enzyme
MNLHFGRETCNYLKNATSKEWLVTNGLGSYACGTVSGILTRRYHGYLLAASENPVDRRLLVSKIGEVIEYNGTTYDLDSNLWQDQTVAPCGYLNLESFSLDGKIPVWRYGFADGLLEKRIWMEKGHHTTYINYTVIRAKKSIKIFLKFLLNYRNHHYLTNKIFNFYKLNYISNGVEIQAYQDIQPFFILSKDIKFNLENQWFLNFNFPLEQYRGLDFIEHNFQGVTGNLIIKQGQSVTVVITTERDYILDGKQALKEYQNQEQKLLDYSPIKQAPLWIKQLALAADQFIVKRSLDNFPNGKTIIAGYPWFGDWGRDTMIALPGLTLTTGRFEIARLILETFSYYLDQGMLPNHFPDQGAIPCYNSVDSVLWYFEAIAHYLETTKDEAFLQQLFPLLEEVIAWYRSGTRYQIHLDDDGLIYAGETGVQLTWMDAKVGDYVVTPREGKPVEINALWYNALLLVKSWADQLGKPTTEYEKLANKTRNSFQKFWHNEKGYCYDVLDSPAGNDLALRPNQIFAVSLPSYLKNTPNLLTIEQQKSIIDQVSLNLITSFGLRSLAPDDPNYQGSYGGNQLQRDLAYHQGISWGWLIGHFIQAHLKVYHNPNLAMTYLDPFKQHLEDRGLGTISEIFDGDIPFTPRGCFAQAWSVAEVLRAWFLVQKYL